MSRLSTAILAAVLVAGSVATASAQTAGPCKRQSGGMTYPGPYWVTFDAENATIKADQMDGIKEAAKSAKGMQITQVCIISEAVKVGDKSSNEVLATSRAKAVADELIKHGVEAKHIVIQGSGEAAAGISILSLDAQATERKVSIVLAK
jgi:peptidoglycan-binding protein ArfA